jgi:exopolyphosphatase / guanosine-5'-triphosphate,3'-diphosphate pyrophosphatase
VPDDSTTLAIRHRPIGVIDIGSNSVRLVVYSGVMRTPIPIYNEKATCALGRDLESTGKLNPEGIDKALQILGRFTVLTDAMGLDRLDVLGTAAIRDAADGKKFVDLVKEETGLSIKVLSGKQEAQRSALGVLCGIPDADGMVADLGGGSLELVDVQGGTFAHHATLPLGTLRLAGSSGPDLGKALKTINMYLDQEAWVSGVKGRTVYAVGGAWRSLARVCIAHMNYPLHVLDNFTLTRPQAQSLFGLISNLSPQTLEKIRGVDKSRLQTLPLAATMLERLLEIGQPDNLVFSIYGMREGQFYKELPESLKAEDPLISAAEELCRAAGRDPGLGHEAYDWLSPLFPDETADQAKLRLAACLLRDVYWSEHPDYRAEQAFLRVLRLPFMGLEHEDRAGLALALFYRYRTDDTTPTIDQAHAMLDEERLHRVRTIGLGLRLAYSLTGGAPSILEKAKLDMGKSAVTLTLPHDESVFNGGSYPKRLSRLASHIGRKDKVQFS